VQAAEGEGTEMVIVAGWIDVAAEDRDAYLAARIEGMLATRDEPGCIDYVFSADPTTPERLRLFERWASQADLDTHLQVMRSRPSTPSTFTVTGREVLVHDVATSKPLG
jgi:quinol monooxygenase YgiN